jgi:hypothetical protein
VTQILNQSRTHSTSGPFGARGDDTFTFDVPAGEVFDSCQLTIQGATMSSSASLSVQPASGQTGQLSATVHWYYNAFGKVQYQVTAQSRVAGAPPGSHVRVPGFLPSTSGFHFDNQFASRPDLVITVPTVGQIGIGDAANGLCGGMAHAARDYFQSGRPVPAFTAPPTDGPLFDYLVKRLFDSFSLPLGPARYLELMNPDLPDHETLASSAGLAPHGRAWRMIRDEWPLIKGDLDAGRPSPLALVSIKSRDPRDLGKNHQVLAYGYDLVGNQLTLRIYDPNFHNNDNFTLSLDLSDPGHTTPVAYSDTGRTVFAFFRTDYAFSAPPLAGLVPGRVMLFEDRDFAGRFKEVQSADPDLTASSFNDRVSSIAILSGNWTLFRDSQFANPYQRNGAPLVLGPGLYAWVEDHGVGNDSISSLRAVTDPANG